MLPRRWWVKVLRRSSGIVRAMISDLRATMTCSRRRTVLRRKPSACTVRRKVQSSESPTSPGSVASATCRVLLLPCFSRNFIGCQGPEGWHASPFQMSSKLVNPLWKYCSFLTFQYSRRCHLGFSNSWNFICLRGTEGRDAHMSRTDNLSNAACMLFYISESNSKMYQQILLV